MLCFSEICISKVIVICSWRGVLDTTLSGKVCKWLATGRWVSPGTPVSSTNKTDSHDIIEILLKVVLNTINLIRSCRVLSECKPHNNSTSTTKLHTNSSAEADEFSSGQSYKSKDCYIMFSIIHKTLAWPCCFTQRGRLDPLNWLQRAIQVKRWLNNI